VLFRLHHHLVLIASALMYRLQSNFLGEILVTLSATLQH
jgi:hypothetical protein